METLLIQLTNHKALGLLHEMEALDLIKVIEEPAFEEKKFFEKYAGKLSPEVADELQEYVSKSREEWNERDI